MNTSKKVMLKLFKSALTEIEAIPLKFCTTELTFKSYPDDKCFTVTVFNKKSHNYAFSFYNFYSEEEIKSSLSQLIEKIKTDDFKVIEDFSNGGA